VTAMSTKNRSFGRRAFLNKLGLTSGAVFLTPILDGMLREAYGQFRATKRFVLYVSAHGFASRHAGNVYSGLTPHRAETIVFRNLFNTTHQFLHTNSYAATSGYKVASPSKNYGYGEPGGPSIDYLLAQELGKGTREPLMVLNGSTMSASGMQKPIPGIGSPSAAFSKYFGSGTGGTSDQERARLLKMERSFLDFMMDDIKRSQAELAAREREKLDLFLTSVREMEQKLAAAGTGAVPASCKSFTAPGGSGVTGTMRAHGVLAAHALACGITRHVSMGFSGGNFSIPDLGVSPHQHQVHHNGATGVITRVLDFHSQVVGNIFGILKKFPEGNGTMADNTLIAWVSDGGSHHRGYYDAVAVLVGTAGKAIKQTGKVITYENQKYPMNEFWLTAARAMGSQMAKFGDGTNPCRGPLPDILA
jgi:hypothetical protein